MKYFVTGGTGFIGSALVKQLIKNNHKIIVYDNLSSGNLNFLDDFKKNTNFQFIKGDILDSKKLEKSMKNCDFVFHLAANPDIRQGTMNKRLDLNINTIGTINVLDAMSKNKISKLAFTSSSTVFGLPSEYPTDENYGPSLPISLYGASKLACEAYISSYAYLFNIKSWIFRLANITGKPATHGIIFDFSKKIKKNKKTLVVLGDGNQEKSYLTNTLLVDAMLFVIKKTQKTNNSIFVYNLGNDDKIKIRQIAKLFVKELGYGTKLTFTGGKGGWKGDVPKMYLSNKKLKHLGWKPTLTSKECILEAIRSIKPE